jgi:hypothetical protein
MPIRFYTTDVDAEKTAREMQKILSSSDARRVHKEWLNAVLAFRNTRQAQLDQLLLGFGVTGDGRTVHERLVDDRKLPNS